MQNVDQQYLQLVTCELPAWAVRDTCPKRQEGVGTTSEQNNDDISLSNLKEKK